MTLERRTPLARGAGPKADPAKTRAWTDRSRKRLPPRSAKRVEEAPLRALVVATALARDGGCRAPGMGAPGRCGGPLDGHEPIPRSDWPAGYLVLGNVLTICRVHHDWIHNGNPEMAVRLGLLHPDRR